jgi:hypothetical protein
VHVLTDPPALVEEPVPLERVHQAHFLLWCLSWLLFRHVSFFPLGLEVEEAGRQRVHLHGRAALATARGGLHGGDGGGPRLYAHHQGADDSGQEERLCESGGGRSGGWRENGGYFVAVCGATTTTAETS